MSADHKYEIKDEASYQNMANRASRAVYDLLQGIHQVNYLGRTLGEGESLDGQADAGPVISGCVGGLLSFYMDGDGDPYALAGVIKEQLDSLIPQRLMDKAEQEAGAVGGGNA